MTSVMAAARLVRGLVSGALVAGALLLALPGTASILAALVEHAQDACCDGLGGAGEERDCPTSCAHCACCAHPSMLPAIALAWSDGALELEVTFVSQSTGGYVSGHPLAPFRPPTV